MIEISLIACSLKPYNKKFPEKTVFTFDVNYAYIFIRLQIYKNPEKLPAKSFKNLRLQPFLCNQV